MDQVWLLLVPHFSLSFKNISALNFIGTWLTRGETTVDITMQDEVASRLDHASMVSFWISCLSMTT